MVGIEVAQVGDKIVLVDAIVFPVIVRSIVAAIQFETDTRAGYLPPDTVIAGVVTAAAGVGVE